MVKSFYLITTRFQFILLSFFQYNIQIYISKELFGTLEQLSEKFSLFHKLKCSNPYIFTTWKCKSLTLQIYIIWSNRIYGLIYLRSKTLGCKDKGIRKSEFVAKEILFAIHCYYSNSKILLLLCIAFIQPYPV